MSGHLNGKTKLIHYLFAIEKMGSEKHHLILVAILVLISTSTIQRVFGGGCFSDCDKIEDCTSSVCPHCLTTPIGSNFCSFDPGMDKSEGEEIVIGW